MSVDPAVLTLAERLEDVAGQLADAKTRATAREARLVAVAHRLDRVRRLHAVDGEGYCVEDGWRWPCRTARTVDDRPVA